MDMADNDDEDEEEDREKDKLSDRQDNLGSKDMDIMKDRVTLITGT